VLVLVVVVDRNHRFPNHYSPLVQWNFGLPKAENKKINKKLLNSFLSMVVTNYARIFRLRREMESNYKD